jgi:carbon monoxide dehydrogenase subunit G
MDLEHNFTVPVGIDTAWGEFQNIASIAECFPGATVTGVEGDSFEGSVKVKLGPIALVYNGSGTFTEKDESAHRFVVDAKGKDKRGNGTAGATVTVAMAGSGSSTDVKVHTDLAITGKPAQFGRGVMQDVSDKLLAQFVACLEQRLGGGAHGTAPVAAAPGEAAPREAAPGEAAPTEAASIEAAPGEPAPAPEVATAGEPAPSDVGKPPPAVAEPVEGAPAPPTSSTPRSDDALDLGRTVLPVLARTYWKPALIVLVVVVVIIWLIAR